MTLILRWFEDLSELGGKVVRWCHIDLHLLVKEISNTLNTHMRLVITVQGSRHLDLEVEVGGVGCVVGFVTGVWVCVAYAWCLDYRDLMGA